MPTYTYNFCTGVNDPVDFPRALTSDTNVSGGGSSAVWADEEIIGLTRLQALQFQSSMTYSGSAGQNLPSSPVSYLRVAALLLDAMANNEAKLSATLSLLDWKGDRAKASAALHAQAKALREVDDDSGAFAIIEQCSTVWGLRDRFWKQVQRQSAP